MGLGLSPVAAEPSVRVGVRDRVRVRVRVRVSPVAAEPSAPLAAVEAKARYCRSSLAVSVLPAPDSPEMT